MHLGFKRIYLRGRPRVEVISDLNKNKFQSESFVSLMTLKRASNERVCDNYSSPSLRVLCLLFSDMENNNVSEQKTLYNSKYTMTLICQVPI